MPPVLTLRCLALPTTPVAFLWPTTPYHTTPVGHQADRGRGAVTGGELDDGGRRWRRRAAGVPAEPGARPGKDAVVDGVSAVWETEEGRLRRAHGRGKLSRIFSWFSCLGREGKGYVGMGWDRSRFGVFSWAKLAQ